MGQERNLDREKGYIFGWTKFILLGCMLRFYKTGRQNRRVMGLWEGVEGINISYVFSVF